MKFSGLCVWETVICSSRSSGSSEAASSSRQLCFNILGVLCQTIYCHFSVNNILEESLAIKMSWSLTLCLLSAFLYQIVIDEPYNVAALE